MGSEPTVLYATTPRQLISIDTHARRADGNLAPERTSIERLAKPRHENAFAPARGLSMPRTHLTSLMVRLRMGMPMLFGVYLFESITHFIAHFIVEAHSR